MRVLIARLVKKLVRLVLPVTFVLKELQHQLDVKPANFHKLERLCALSALKDTIASSDQQLLLFAPLVLTQQLERVLALLVRLDFTVRWAL
jgi:hypothetical protein